jgi:hypothetical protein
MGDASILVQRDRYLADAYLAEARADQHLRGELHPRAAQGEPVVDVAPEATHPAIDVADRHVEPLFAMRLNIGFPSHRCRKGIAPGLIVPPPRGSRQPCTMS